MGPLGWTLATTIAISLTAWLGAFALFVREDLLDRLLLVLVALAAGSLIGGAFFHLLPRAIAATGATETLPLFVLLVAGFCAFYVLEQFISWHHHHGGVDEHQHEPVTYLVLVSDTVHNLLDGIVIAGAFLVNVELGLVTTAAIALHEIPQEIGDFGVLVYGGFDRRSALVLNFLTQATVIVGGVAGYVLGTAGLVAPTSVLPFAAGSFVYIASSDLIPEIKHGEDVRKSAVYFGVFVAGLLAMLSIRFVRPLLG